MEMISIFYAPKGSEIQLTQNFKLKEYQCRCNRPTCNHALLSTRLADRVQLLRNHYKKPIHITSGFRCQEHNKEVGGVNGSYHQLGLAADLAPDRPEDLGILKLLAESLFDRVIYYKEKGFIHCQINKEGDK